MAWREFKCFGYGYIYPLAFVWFLWSAAYAKPDGTHKDSCPRLVSAIASISIPKPLAAIHRRLINLSLDDLLANTQALGLKIALPPDESESWRHIRTYPTYVENWANNHLDSKESYGEYVRAHKLALINLRARAFHKSKSDRALLLRWTLLHEYSHFWIEENLYPSQERRKNPQISALYSQEVYVIPEYAISKIERLFERVPEREKAIDALNLYSVALQRTVLEEILIEKSLNDAWAKNKTEKVGRLKYMISALRTLIYSLSNLLEIAWRLRDKSLLSDSDLKLWQHQFETVIRQSIKTVKETIDLEFHVLLETKSKTGKASRHIESIKTLLAKSSRSLNQSLAETSDLTTPESRSLRLWGAKLLESIP